MPFETLVFDLDDTLYPKSCGLMTAVAHRIQSYVERVTGLSPDVARTTRLGYLARYGTTWRGLREEYPFDLDDYMRFVHDIDCTAYVRPNPQLDAMLGRLPQRKIIFTNGTRRHCQSVLDALAIAHHFDLILDIHTFDYNPKPADAAYQCLLRHLPHEPQAALYLDDRLDNLLAASRLGLATVLVAENGYPPNTPCPAIAHILELETLLAVGYSLSVNGHPG
jgi:putative hydrolase of the HAD superfamily